MIRWANSVGFENLHPAILLALHRADALYAAHGVDVWMTSLNDGVHGRQSFHDKGRAVDLRVHHLPTEAAREQLAVDLARALGPHFDVVYEAAGTPNAHIHVEYHPKRPEHGLGAVEA